jgi:VanZ family protein
LDEIHQIFIPGRYCELLDWFADFAGVLFAALFLNFLVKYSNFLESN